MVYRLLGWECGGYKAYHKIQIVSCASAKITLNFGISTQANNIPRYSEVVGIQGLGQL